MRTFIAACAAALVVAIGCAIILDQVNRPVDAAYTSSASVRI